MVCEARLQEIQENGTTGSFPRDLAAINNTRQILSPPTWKRDTTVSGSPSVGEVIHFAQQHKIDAATTTYRTVSETAENQAAIVRKLEAMGIKFVFKEGLTEDIEPNDPKRMTKLDTKEIRSAFPDGKIPEHLSPYQQMVLYRRGAARVYGALHPDVTLLKTNSQEEEDAFDKIIDDPKTPEAMHDEYVFSKRQANAMREVSAFLKQHPGQRVAIVYGAHHTFTADDFRAYDKSGPFPLVRKFSHSSPISRDVPSDIDKINDRMERERLIRQGSFISYVMFYALSPEEQIIALPKLKGQSEHFASPEAFKEDLLRVAKSNEARRRITNLYKTRQGPFREFLCREPVEWNWKDVSSWSPGDVALKICNEPCPRTQFRLIQEAKSIKHFAFAEIRTEYGQLAALAKLVAFRKDFKDIAELKKFMLEDACSDKVREAIEDLFKKREGPFKGWQ